MEEIDFLSKANHRHYYMLNRVHMTHSRVKNNFKWKWNREKNDGEKYEINRKRCIENGAPDWWRYKQTHTHSCARSFSFCHRNATNPTEKGDTRKSKIMSILYEGIVYRRRDNTWRLLEYSDNNAEDTFLLHISMAAAHKVKYPAIELYFWSSLTLCLLFFIAV